jgi:hypothetical protein
MRGRGVTRGDSVSSHLRSGIAAFFVVAGFSTPAFSNAFTDLFTPNAAPEQPTAAATPAKEECLSQPGRSAAAGQHWVYRYDGQRKCWFQAAEETALARKPVRHPFARRSVAASEEDKPAPRQQENVEDARAELLNSAPAQTPQPAPSEPKLTIVHTIPVRVADAAGQVPPAPVLNQPGADQPAPDQPRRLDAETLLAKAPAAGEEVASSTPAIAARTAKTGGGEDWIVSWLGVLLIALGGAALLTSSRTLRRALWPVPFLSSRTEFPVVAYDDWDDPSFAEAIPSASARRDELSGYEPQGAASVRAARTRRPVAPAVPSQEAFWDEEIGALAALASPASPEVFRGRRAMAYRGAEQRDHWSGS